MNSTRLEDETTLVLAVEALTGHAVHEIHSHRAIKSFGTGSSVAWLAAAGIMATLITGAIVQGSESHAEPLAHTLATAHGFTLYNPPTLLPQPPVHAPRAHADFATAVPVLFKPQPVVIAPAPTIATPTPTAVPIVRAANTPSYSSSNSKVQIVIAYALRQQGKRYVWNTAGPNTFDCSGLTMAAYAQVGIHMGHYTGDQLRMGIRVSRSQLRPGDLVFPSSGHVGIYLGNNKAIFAPHSGSVVQIQTLYSFYTARRILT